jgi:hypothetical protein
MHARALALSLATFAALGCGGCEQAKDLLASPPHPSAQLAVRPTEAPTEMLQLVVEGERELGPIARSLGTTVEDLISDNALAPGQRLRDGQRLQVRSSRPELDAYLERRDARRRARLERAEATRAAALAAKTERGARRKRANKARAKRKRAGKPANH